MIGKRWWNRDNFREVQPTTVRVGDRVWQPAMAYSNCVAGPYIIRKIRTYPRGGYTIGFDVDIPGYGPAPQPIAFGTLFVPRFRLGA